jgi:spore germination protein GerM
MRFLPAASAILALALPAGCGGSQAASTLYFLHGARGVLEPVARESVPTTPTSVVAALLRGPSASEREWGLRPAVHARVRAFTVATHGGTAVVDYSGAELGLTAAASLVFTLTELPGIERVSLRLDGRPCCAYDHHGRAIDPLTRRLYRGWSREPCSLRTYPDAVRCRAE